MGVFHEGSNSFNLLLGVLSRFVRSCVLDHALCVTLNQWHSSRDYPIARFEPLPIWMTTCDKTPPSSAGFPFAPQREADTVHSRALSSNCFYSRVYGHLFLCGQPGRRTVYDQAGDRHGIDYFVGNQCLTALAHVEFAALRTPDLLAQHPRDGADDLRDDSLRNLCFDGHRDVIGKSYGCY